MAHSFSPISWHSFRKLMTTLGRASRLASGVGLSLILSGCTATETEASSDPRPNVVASTTIIADLTEDIAGDTIQLSSILQPGDDPHSYGPISDELSATLDQADLVLYNGLNLVPALEAALESDRPTHLAIGEVADVIALEQPGQTAPDPHIWGDVTYGIAMVNTIRDSLIDLAPENQALYIANAQTLNAQLADLDTWISRQIETIPKDNRILVTHQEGFQYYAQAYDLELLNLLADISGEQQPSDDRLQQLTTSLKTRPVPALFADPQINWLKTVAAEAGVEVAAQTLYSDSLGDPGSPTESYRTMMEWNTQAIVEGLGGTHTPFMSEAPVEKRSAVETTSPATAAP